jgi:glycosyltransferase involved in cell wall biosynthesis
MASHTAHIPRSTPTVAALHAHAAADDRLRVAIVSTERGWGGGEQQARLLACGLRRRGHDVRLFARRGAPLAERIAAEEFPVETFAGRGISPRALWSLRRKLRAWRPHVVHSNDPHALTAAGIASLGLGTPARIASRRVVFPIRSPGRYRKLADVVIAISGAVADVCRAAGIAGDRLRVVYSGVDPARAEAGDAHRGRASLGTPPGDPMLLTVASLTDCKGHRYLIEAMPEILRTRPSAKLFLAGRGELAAELAALARRLGIADRVVQLGFRDDASDLIAACDLFVLPSHTEGLCSTLIDVMLAQRPIVATTAGGIPELLGDVDGEGEIGSMVPPRDSRRLAAAVLETLDARETIQQRCRRARQRALDRFTADPMVEATLAVYREAMQAHATSR